VASRQAVGHFLPAAIFSAVAGALPDRLIAPGADPIWLTVWRGPRFTQTIFQVGGTGARPTKDGLSATGFPSGVAGVPAEVIESLSPLVMQRRELWTDSGGPGAQRGGLGQLTSFSNRSGERWSVSCIVDRTRYPAPGLLGGADGTAGEVLLASGERLSPKAQVDLAHEEVVHLNPPGGGGFGDPFERDPERVRRDVVAGYVSPEAARRDYGVVVRYTGRPNALVRLDSDYQVDLDATASLRTQRNGHNGRREQ
jgi:N-methylhydantoinase B